MRVRIPTTSDGGMDLAIEVPRFMYHKPPWDYDVRRGLKAYPLRSKESEILEDFPKGTDNKVVWLSPDPRSHYARSGFKVDLSKLDPSNLRPTWQAEGNVVHAGDIPASAIVAVGKVATKSELNRLVDEYLRSPEGSYPDPQSCADTKGRCDGVANRLCAFLTRKGLECEVWEGTGLLPELGEDAHEEWKGFKGEDQKFLFHVVVRVGDSVVDLTGAQYGKAFSKPYVKPFSEFRRQWKQVKPSKWQDWKHRVAAPADGSSTGDSTEWVGLFLPLPKRLAEQFPKKEGDDKTVPHCTFLYVGNVKGREQEFLGACQEVISGEFMTPVQAVLEGMDSFANAHTQRRVFYCKVRFSHGMAELREKLFQRLRHLGFDVKDVNPLVYSPHVTLEYKDGLDSEYEGIVPTGSWIIDSVEVWGMPQVQEIPLHTGSDKVAGQWLRKAKAQIEGVTVHQYLRATPTGGREKWELFHLERHGIHYLAEVRRGGVLQFGVELQGRKSQISRAFDQQKTNLLSGVEMYSHGAAIETDKPDAHATKSLQILLSPTWGPDWSEAGSAGEEDDLELKDFHKKLTRQLRDWKGSSNNLRITNHSYWPQFQRMVVEQVKKKYGSKIRLYRGIRGDQAKDILKGTPVKVRPVSSWAPDLDSALQYRGNLRRDYWVVVAGVFKAEQVALAPVRLPDYLEPDILMKLATDVYHDGDEFVLFIPSGTPKVKIVRRSRKALAAMKSLSDTGNRSWSGGTIWQANVAKDEFIHFTTPERAQQILAAGKLLMNPPYDKFGTDVVSAVSTRWGWWQPSVQVTHIKSKDVVGLVFKTTTQPAKGFPEEVVWHKDVVLRGPKVVSLSQGKSMLSRTPERVGADDEVAYRQARVGMILPAVGKEVERTRKKTWVKTYRVKGGEVEIRFYEPDRRNPFSEDVGVFMAWEGEEAVGHLNVNFSPRNPSKEVAFDIEVAAKARRRGVGTALLNAARDKLKKKPVPSSYAFQLSKPPSEDAQHLWESFKSAARPIPVDRKQIQQLTKLALKALKADVENIRPDWLNTPWGGRWQKVVGTYSAQNVKGQVISVPVLIKGTPQRKGSGTSWGGAKSRVWVHNGELVFSGADPKQVVVRLNGRIPRSDILAHLSDIGREIFSLLIHEATHVHDVLTPTHTRSQQEYINLPHEVRAFMQQIVDEVLQYRREHESATVEESLKDSMTWQQRGWAFTPKNRKYILKAVYTAVQEAGLLR